MPELTDQRENPPRYDAAICGYQDARHFDDPLRVLIWDRENPTTNEVASFSFLEMVSQFLGSHRTKYGAGVKGKTLEVHALRTALAEALGQVDGFLASAIDLQGARLRAGKHGVAGG